MNYGNMEFSRVFITGDTHGISDCFTNLNTPIEKELKQKDLLLIAGDFGFVWDDSDTERSIRRMIADKPYTVAFVDGNHENFDLLYSMPVEEWCGGKVHIVEKDSAGIPKIIHLMRGQIFEIAGKTIFTMGGGYSMDRFRRREGISWWPQELPSNDEIDQAIDKLAEHGNRVDYIVTHTTRDWNMQKLFGFHRTLEEKHLNNFLEYVHEITTYEHWYFGHIHVNKDISERETAIASEVRNLLTGEVIGRFEESLIW